MKSFHIKFPRRVRIHGGECGAVARALHHEAHEGALTQFEQSLISDEKASKRQADLGKYSGSTFNERKQMSTKTSIKRIALVAVSALGFGLLSVVPAKAEVIAADITFTKTDTTANTISAPTARGAQITAALSLTTIDGAGAGDGVPSAATTIPATFQLLDPNGTDVTSQATFAVASSVTAGVTATVSSATYTLVLAAAAALGDRTFGTMTFTPSMGGRYTLRVTRGATTGVVLAAAA
ncbi:MAG: hypothetical protein EBW14_19430, partial [Oxalobacteraceae bacterium]|nr:hypothetical protein [Oxalobacteraceae bacterium]